VCQIGFALGLCRMAPYSLGVALTSVEGSECFEMWDLLEEFAGNLGNGLAAIDGKNLAGNEIALSGQKEDHLGNVRS
jgi:hypothetical protein